jgi:hypothetical protein
MDDYNVLAGLKACVIGFGVVFAIIFAIPAMLFAIIQVLQLRIWKR